MAIDLTRFDFHVLRFMKSLDVMAMTPEEIGEYILLLSESWLIGDDCTLPDDMKLFATLARTDKVSPKVLKKFPVIPDTEEWGGRRRNPILYEEWRAAEKRSLDSSEKGRKGNEIKYSPQRDRSEAVAIPVRPDPTSPKPNRAEPIRTKPNQSDPDQCQGDFKFIRTRFRSFFHLKPADREKDVLEYLQACSSYGEDWVLAQFDLWAPENMWVREKKNRFGLSTFYKELAEIREADSLSSARESVQKLDTSAVDLGYVEEQKAREAAVAAEELAKREKEKALVNDEI